MLKSSALELHGEDGHRKEMSTAWRESSAKPGRGWGKHSVCILHKINLNNYLSEFLRYKI